VSALSIAVDVTGLDKTQARLQALGKALAGDRGPLHSAIAQGVMEDTAKFLKKSASHRTAGRLGAAPTGFRARNASALSAQADGTQAVLLIPRRTGLGRAFGEVVLLPGSGRTYLTISAHQETYGRVVRDFPEETFKFAVIGGHFNFCALVFRTTAGRHQKGEVGYWLKRKIIQKQDRTLLPSDAEWREGARDHANIYLAQAIYHNQS